mgnify:CR=1 FL=1
MSTLRTNGKGRDTMLKSKITLRLTASFLLVVLASLTLLGAYLLNYFHDRPME